MEKLNLFDAIDANKRNSIVLLIFVFLLLVTVGWAFSYVLGLDDFGFLITIFIVLIYMFIMYFIGDWVVLDMSGAKPATREKYPYLYHIVEGMAIAANIPVPRIYVVEDRSPNAFAVGRDPKRASVAVTTGLLNNLSQEELEGVIAHEISHIANYDVRFILYAVIMLGTIAFLSDITWRGLSRSSGRNRKGAGPLILIAVVLLILAPIFGQLIRLAISREREYLADANGSKITRNPEGLAKALEKLKGNKIQVKNATETTASIYFSNPFPQKMISLFSTHPQIDDRVKRLRSL